MRFMVCCALLVVQQLGVGLSLDDMPPLPTVLLNNELTKLVGDDKVNEIDANSSRVDDDILPPVPQQMWSMVSVVCYCLCWRRIDLV